MSIVGMKSRQNRDTEIASLRAMLLRKEREITEAHHRIANSLQLAAGLLLHQRNRSKDRALRAALDAAAARLAAAGKLHGYLYAYSAGSEVDLKPFLEYLCPQIGECTGLRCDIDVEPIQVAGDVAQNLAIVINEFSLNAAKHAYGGQEGGRLMIECHRTGDALELIVSDSGRGLAEDFSIDDRSGCGFSIIASITQQLGGKLLAASNGGARFTLQAPLP